MKVIVRHEEVLEKFGLSTDTQVVGILDPRRGLIFNPTSKDAAEATVVQSAVPSASEAAAPSIDQLCGLIAKLHFAVKTAGEDSEAAKAIREQTAPIYEALSDSDKQTAEAFSAYIKQFGKPQVNAQQGDGAPQRGRGGGRQEGR
jgi:hypothetical protein